MAPLICRNPNDELGSHQHAGITVSDVTCWRFPTFLLGQSHQLLPSRAIFEIFRVEANVGSHSAGFCVRRFVIAVSCALSAGSLMRACDASSWEPSLNACARNWTASVSECNGEWLGRRVQSGTRLADRIEEDP